MTVLIERNMVELENGLGKCHKFYSGFQSVSCMPMREDSQAHRGCILALPDGRRLSGPNCSVGRAKFPLEGGAPGQTLCRDGTCGRDWAE